MKNPRRRVRFTDPLARVARAAAGLLEARCRALRAFHLLAALSLAAGAIALVYLLAPFLLAATPPAGTVSETTTGASWAGQSYVVAAVALPDQCPAAADPVNALCDHYALNVNVPGNFWDSNTGSVTITITWGSADNDFDLYVYDPNGALADSSAAGGTTSEQVTLISPMPGVYEVRVVPFLVVNSGYQGVATLSFQSGGPTPNPTRSTGGLSFAPAVVTDAQRTESEPLNFIDQNGRIWDTGPWGLSTGQSFLHLSVDDGDSYDTVSPLDVRPDPNCPAGGGDSDVVVDDQGKIYFSDLELANVHAAVSTDGGNNWACTLVSNAGSGEDRQWLAIDNGTNLSSGPAGAADNTAFLTFRVVAVGVVVTSSTDGLLYVPASDQPLGEVRSDAVCGQTVFDPVKRNLYLPCGGGNHMEITRGHVNTTEPGQRTGIAFTTVPLPTSPGGAVGDIFPALATDIAGNLYAVWADPGNHNIYLSTSQDEGSNWTPPVQVNGDPSNTSVWPWVKAREPGHAAIVWYGTETRGDNNNFTSWYNNRVGATGVKWFPYLAIVQNALSGTPSFFQNKILEHPNHYGQLCTGGLGCSVSGSDRTMADYFALSLDVNGAARVTFNDTTSQHHAASVFEARQRTGPTAAATTLSGSELPTPITNPINDPSGDAFSPRFVATPVAQPAMDFKSLGVSQPTAGELQVTMKVANAGSLLPPPGSSSIVWLTRFQVRAAGDEGEESYRLFYLGAKSVAGGAPTFFSGSGTSSDGTLPGDGCITNTPENCKIVRYPEEKAATGSFDALSGTIVVRAPLGDLGAPVVGDKLYSVTALSFGVRIPSSSLPDSQDPLAALNALFDDVDATRAFDYIIASDGGRCPPNCPPDGGRKVTGGGYIASTNLTDKANFGFNARENTKGKATYQDHGADMMFKSTRITSVLFDGNRVTISGQGSANGQETDFVIQVEDNGQSGTTDKFSIQLGSGHQNSGVLLGGNIQIH